ncbi:isopentenyl transferase family protein, partial [Streptomyces sp. NPDC002812]|uniref:tRNA (adenosine(37)-N6)-dimethylallyltransferase n=1 Tax=Streptomyces sp. NPDC002812 TaxID=3154434 RepID=UPI00332EFA3F
MSSAPPTPRVIAVVGPTAAGKSDLGVFLAQKLGGEVVNADSMQLYRGMDIGTAKLTPEERGGVPHHLLDIWDVTETASVAEYQRLARQRIDALLAEGRWPILVGGSGLYVRGAVDNLSRSRGAPRSPGSRAGSLRRGTVERGGRAARRA